MLKIQEIKDKKVWEDFIDRADFYPFFQSWDWGDVQKNLGRKILRIGAYEETLLIGVCLVIEINARRGRYLHLRHGPVFLVFDERKLDAILDFIKKEASRRGSSFIRISPLLNKDSESEKILQKKGFINSPIHNMDAETCLILDLEKSEEDLLKEMRKTHRYLIRKAQNMGIKIIRTQKVSDLNSFLDIYKNLSKRKHFVPHSDVKEEFELFVEDDQAVLFLASFRKKIICGAIIIFAGNMAIYHHGASLDEFRDVPISYLLQWEAILEAKKRGKKLYNFWGITPLDKPNHPWKGITLFKTGFGGTRLEFMHAKDLPLNIWYWKSFLIEFYTKWKKGY
ncbi:MAG: peptidoglycan bridge formation glycyltransferase FemA/FemB family protein [Candidatus Levyibacteriota bacterium]